MEAIEFLKEYNRMCVECRNCSGCPLKGTECSIGSGLSEEEMINIVGKTEQWSKEHPIITNARKFKEVFGWPQSDIDSLRYARAWWDEPYKEPEKEVKDENHS